MSTRKSPKDRIPIPIAIKRRAAALQQERSRNALLLPGEDASKLEALNTDFHEYFRPASLVEVALITQMVSACWRFNRTSGYESILLTQKAEELLADHRKTYNTVDHDRLFTQAYEQISATPVAQSINRTLTTCRNTFRGALADLEKVRKLKGDPNQPFLTAPTGFLSCTDFAEPVPHTPARIFEMPAPAQPAAEAPPPPADLPPQPTPEPHPNHQWFESEDYQEPAPQPAPEPEPAVPCEPPAPVLRDINGNPIVIHKQVKPKFGSAELQWVASPEDRKFLQDPILARILNPQKPPAKK